MPISEIIDKQMPSISEWMEKISKKNIDNFRQEDNNKRDRLEILHKIIGLDYDKPKKLTALDITQKTLAFKKVFKIFKNEKCALRLVPITPGLPKLRVRGKTLKQNLHWFYQQKINPENYKVEVIPHNDDTNYSAIFIVNNHGIWGEITPGMHWQLTQGIYDSQPLSFFFDFKKWHFFADKKNDTKIKTLIKKAVKKIWANNSQKAVLKKQLRARFTKTGYIKGYFEFVVWPPKNKISFIDYNRLINHDVKIFKKTKPSNNIFVGLPASNGKTKGEVVILLKPKKINIQHKILICPMTTIDYLPLMQKAKGIITEQGTLLSHAAIIARELKKPCVVAVKNITKLLKTGDKIVLDANQGIIYKEI